MDTEILKEISSKLEVLNLTLKELVDITKNGNTETLNVFRVVEHHLLQLSDAIYSDINDNGYDNTNGQSDQIGQNCENNTFTPDESSINTASYRIKQSMKYVWNRSLNERKQAYWNYLKFKNTAAIYSEWIKKDNPIIPRKYRPKIIPGEVDEDKDIRRETSLQLFEADIKILKNKSRRYENAFKQTDDEMCAIFEKKSDGEICRNLKKIWGKECKKEEEKSAAIFEKKLKWLKEYENNFGTDIFVHENSYDSSKNKRPWQNINRNTSGDNYIRDFTHRSNHVQHTFRNTNPTVNYANNTQPRNTRVMNRRNKENNSRNFKANQSSENVTYSSKPVTHNGITYIGKNVRQSFLEQSQFDKGGGGNTSVMETNVMVDNEITFRKQIA
jgi:hypothetical protein